MKHRPFSELAGCLRELEQELGKNIPESERAASALAAAALAGFGFSRKGFARWVLLAVSGALAYRATTGYCALYERLEVDRRHGVNGVAGNRGTRYEASVEINCPAERLYRFWRSLEELPRVMRHVESVKDVDGQFSHWKVRGPAGMTLEWDAEIINDHPGEMIAWQSLPGAQVENAGSVRFAQTASGSTRVKVALEMDPPAGALGTMFAGLLGHSPKATLAEDLAAFKDFAERELAA